MEFNILTNNTCCQPENSCCEPSYPVAILGAGPIGLAAAANLKAYNIPFFIIEKGEIAESVRSWEHVQLFSPWEFNVDAAAKRLLEETGWLMPTKNTVPTGKQLREQYLIPLAQLFTNQIHTNESIIAITRQDTDKMKDKNRSSQPFLVFTQNENITKTYQASAIIDATGTWGNPNPAITHGTWLPSEKALAAKINYSIPNIEENKSYYANKRVAVVGSGHSAIHSLLQLVELKQNNRATEITWILRKKRVEDALGGGNNDELSERGELGLKMQQILMKETIAVETRFMIQSIIEKDEAIFLEDDKKAIGPFDALIVNTGNRPDYSFVQELRVSVDAKTEAVPALANLIDPNFHSCGSVPAHGEKELRQLEQNFYVVGSKSYGRAPTFLMATGYEQVRSIAAYLAGDFESAEAVNLHLPETGVCHTGITGCCE